MLNNPLWCEVYMNKDKDKDDSSDDGGHDPEDGYSSTDELLE